MSEPSEDLHTLVGLYVVDALDGDERQRFEEHLAGCAACSAEVAEFRATAGRLSNLMAENPPPGLRSAILERVSGTRQVSPLDEGAAAGTDEVAAPSFALAPAGRRSRSGRCGVGDRPRAGHRLAPLPSGLRPPAGRRPGAQRGRRHERVADRRR